MSSFVDLCPDAAAQLAVVLAVPSEVGSPTRPLLDRAATLRVWAPKARIAAASAAAACCACPVTLLEIARRDRREQVLAALSANPVVPLEALWCVVASPSMGSVQGQVVRQRAAQRAAQLVTADLPELVVTAGSVLAAAECTPEPRRPPLYSPVAAAVLAAGEATGVLPSPEAVGRLVMVGALTEQLVSGLVKASLVEPNAATSVALRAELRTQLPGPVDQLVRRHLVQVRPPEVVEQCCAELVGRVSFEEAVSVFTANPSSATSALVAAAPPPSSSKVSSKALDACADPLFPAGVAARLPAAPASVVRALCDAGVPSGSWAFALTLCGDDSELTAGAVVDLVVAAAA